MKRLFAFGCSLTQFIWPTWADILGKEFDYFENWGLAGAGNLYIFNSIIECINRNNLTENDTIIIMWSGITRVDYYHTNSWQPQGGDFDFVNCDIRGHEIINFGYIDAIKKLLNGLGVNYKMFSMSEFSKDSNVYTCYSETIDSVTPSDLIWENRTITLDKSAATGSYFFNQIEQNYNRNKGSSWPAFADYFFDPGCITDNVIAKEIHKTMESFGKGYKILMSELTVKDSHPGPLEHLRFLQNKLPEFLISQSTKDWTSAWESRISQNNYIPYSTSFPEHRL